MSSHQDEQVFSPVDVEALVRQCIRWKVEPCIHSSVESAHRLLAVLPCFTNTMRGQLGDPIELVATIRRNFRTTWTCAIGGKVEHHGCLENCVTKIAQHCIPPDRSEARTA